MDEGLMVFFSDKPVYFFQNNLEFFTSLIRI